MEGVGSLFAIRGSIQQPTPREKNPLKRNVVRISHSRVRLTNSTSPHEFFLPSSMKRWDGKGIGWGIESIIYVLTTISREGPF